MGVWLNCAESRCVCGCTSLTCVVELCRVSIKHVPILKLIPGLEWVVDLHCMHMLPCVAECQTYAFYIGTGG